jgi:hypothetical protein
MTRTHEKMRYTPKGQVDNMTPPSAAQKMEDTLKILEGSLETCHPVSPVRGKVLWASIQAERAREV